MSSAEVSEEFSDEELDELFQDESCQNWTFFVSLIPSGISSILILLIIIKSIYKFRKLKTKQNGSPKDVHINPIIKYLYYISSILAMFIIIVCIIASFSECNSEIEHPVLDPDVTLSPISGSFYFILILTILATLLFRLYMTFQGSMFQLSKCQKWSFIIMFSLCIISASTSVIMMYVAGRYYQNIAFFVAESPMLSIYSVIFGLCYVITSFYGMAVFCHKMYGITRSQSISLRNVTNVNNVNINSRQYTLLKAASKYVSLLTLAIFTTLAGFIAFGVFISRWHWMMQRDDGELHEMYELWRIRMNQMVLPLDCAMNMICLYLQFSFAKDDYEKCCGCCGKCWIWCFKIKTENAMKRQYREQEESQSKTETGKSNIGQNSGPERVGLLEMGNEEDV